MTEANSQVMNQAGTVNRVIPKKAVYMRSHEAAEFEKEIETSRRNAENAKNGVTPPEQPSVPPVNNENPTPANTPNPDIAKELEIMKKRYSDLQSDRDKKLAEKDRELLERDNKLKEVHKSKTKYPTSEEELAQWCKEFPPLLPIIQTIALKAVEGRDSELEQKLKDLEEFKKSIANERGRMELLKIHPDANEIEADTRFAQWFDAQEPEIQQLVKTGEPKKIAKCITLYKKELGIVTKTAQDFAKEASKAVNLGPTPPDLPKEQKVWHESEVQKMSTKAYQHYERDIELARVEGRYVYDISRAS